VTVSRRRVALAAVMVCAAGGALVLATLGDQGDGHGASSGAVAALVPASTPVEIALEPRHRSGVTGTARIVPARASLTVTVTLDKRIPSTLLAHIHTGPCSDEPTVHDPRIWANLTEVIDGRSETKVNVVTLRELQSESASINVHDPEHVQRALVCGDIPRAG
jgi:hypothetical protein